MPISNSSIPNVVVTQEVKKVVIPTAGIQGPRGKTILGSREMLGKVQTPRQCN